MSLPLDLAFAPMEADAAKAIPTGDEWEYEPKWDGFRCLSFRDEQAVDITSKSSQPLARYFPEITEALLKLKPAKFVLDGEIIVTDKRSLDFDALLQRIHPAESRIKKLAKETPATLILFDLLVNEKGQDFTGRVLDERRAELEHFAAKYLHGSVRIRLSPRTRDFETKRPGFSAWQGR